jgi:hypothetical protein
MAAGRGRPSAYLKKKKKKKVHPLLDCWTTVAGDRQDCTSPGVQVRPLGLGLGLGPHTIVQRLYQFLGSTVPVLRSTFGKKNGGVM